MEDEGRMKNKIMKHVELYVSPEEAKSVCIHLPQSQNNRQPHSIKSLYVGLARTAFCSIALTVYTPLPPLSWLI
jgi:hypothetical protein